MKYKVVSLFSGCGGMDLGFEQEGFKIIWANDIDHWACETFRLNFDAPIYEGDIDEVDLKTLPDCDVIIGGFPCQDFSSISSIWENNFPGLHTKRGNLYKYFANAVMEKQPSVFIAENVKGLLTANKGKAIKTIVSDFERGGYHVNYGLYDFADYGVPQHRRRVLIVGIKNDIPYTFVPPDLLFGPGKKYPYVTSGEALRGVEKVEHNNEKQNIRKRTEEMLKLIPEGGNFKDIPEESGLRIKGYISHVYRRLHRNEPAYTLIAAGGGGTWGYHYEEPRPLTNRERARLQTFPDDFVFIGSITEVRRQIGNAVSPEGIRPFARVTKSILDGDPEITQIQISHFG